MWYKIAFKRWRNIKKIWKEKTRKGNHKKFS
jgi:hypothetical protein